MTYFHILRVTASPFKVSEISGGCYIADSLLINYRKIFLKYFHAIVVQKLVG